MISDYDQLAIQDAIEFSLRMNRTNLLLGQRSMVMFPNEVKFGDFLIPMTCYSVLKKKYPIQRFLGRVIQIREGVGQFRTDVYFLRCADGIIQPYENEVFVLVHPKKIPLIKAIYQFYEILSMDGDKAEHEITWNGSDPKVGFIISKNE